MEIRTNVLSRIGYKYNPHTGEPTLLLKLATIVSRPRRSSRPNAREREQIQGWIRNTAFEPSPYHAIEYNKQGKPRDPLYFVAYNPEDGTIIPPKEALLDTPTDPLLSCFDPAQTRPDVARNREESTPTASLSTDELFSRDNVSRYLQHSAPSRLHTTLQEDALPQE